MRSGLSDIITPEQIDLSSINGLTSFHPALLASLYLLMIVTIAVAMILLQKKHGLKKAVRHGCIFAFLFVGFLHAVLSEMIWARWLLADWRAFAGASSEDKPSVIDGDYYKFILECKRELGGSNYSLYPHVRLDNGAMNYYDRKLEYYLLPARKVKNSSYIIVLNDSSVTFDENTGVFKSEDGVMLSAQLLRRFAPDAYLLKVNR